MTMHDYGWSLGTLLFWRADVTKSAGFLIAAGWRLRWYGITIPGTHWGIGFLVKRKEGDDGR